MSSDEKTFPPEVFADSGRPITGLDGGDVIFTRRPGEDLSIYPGHGQGGINGGQMGRDGSFIFNLADGTTIMTLGPDGFFVRGVRVDAAVELYNAFKTWMAGTVVIDPPNCEIIHV